MINVLKNLNNLFIEQNKLYTSSIVIDFLKEHFEYNNTSQIEEGDKISLIKIESSTIYLNPEQSIYDLTIYDFDKTKLADFHIIKTEFEKKYNINF